MRYRLDKVVCGFIAQCEMLGCSSDVEALKEFANDELTYADSHRWTGQWGALPKENTEITRGWKSFGGHHGGLYRIRRMEG